MKSDVIVLIKGAGEIASGVAWRLHQAHFKLVLTDIPQPLAVRRAVSFCEAVYDGEKSVEGVTAVRVQGMDGVRQAWNQGRIPVLMDPGQDIRASLLPDVLVEATLSKHNTGMDRSLAPLVIGLGPGYWAGKDVHMVVETNRGHHLGRLYTEGGAEPNTGIPGEMAGITLDRVLRAPAEGIFETDLSIGASVETDDIVAQVNGEALRARIPGILRGLIRPGIAVPKGLKVGDIDPRAREDHVHTISEKARAVGGSVLEAILRVYNGPGA